MRLFEYCFDVFLHLFDGKRGVAAFECGYEIFADGVSACCVVRNFLHGVFDVIGIVHEPEMFPNDFFAGAGIEAGEIGV